MRALLLFPICLAFPLLAQRNDDARAREIALALSAAPAHLVEGAAVQVRTAGGYQLARPGTNGFTCLVEHEDPRTVEPVCYDATGTAAFLPIANAREQWRTAQLTEEEIGRRIADGFHSGTFRGPAGPGVAYMLAPHQTVRDEASGEIVPFVPHLMFYAPNATSAALGLETPDLAAPKGAPFLVFERDPRGLVIVPVAHRP